MGRLLSVGREEQSPPSADLCKQLFEEENIKFCSEWAPDLTQWSGVQ